MDTLPPQLLLIGVLLVLSCILTLARESSIALSDARLKTLAEEGNPRAVRLKKLLDRSSGGFMGAMEVLNLFLGFLISAYTVLFFAQPLKKLLENAVSIHIPVTLIVFVLILAGLFFYLVIGVFVPKCFAAKSAEALALSLSGLTCFVAAILRPFVWLPTAAAHLVVRIFGINPKDFEEEVTEEEIRMMLDIGSESGVIDDDEKQMIHNIFELDDKPVEEIMTHRTDVDILWMEDSVDEWETFINETNHTRYPVCGDAIDDVIGVLVTRDFYRMLLQDRNGDRKALLREPYFVPETIKANELFSQMQDKNTHFTVVLDEYGGFRGVVTQEDILEEIVGELYSEYDEPEQEQEIVQVDENTWRILGSAEIEDVEEALQIKLVDGEYNTFAGMVLDALGTIPDDGSAVDVETQGLKIKVTRIVEHRIEETLVCMTQEVDAEAQAEA